MNRVVAIERMGEAPFAACSRSNLATATCPFTSAAAKGVFPCPSSSAAAAASPSLSSSARTDQYKPWLAATCSGVSPLLSRALSGAPAVMSKAMTSAPAIPFSASEHLAALCSGVSARLFFTATHAGHWDNNSLHTSRAPAPAASCRGTPPTLSSGYSCNGRPPATSAFMALVFPSLAAMCADVSPNLLCARGSRPALHSASIAFSLARRRCRTDSPEPLELSSLTAMCNNVYPICISHTTAGANELAAPAFTSASTMNAREGLLTAMRRGFQSQFPGACTSAPSSISNCSVLTLRQ
mmetsp:Transcript_11551/g.37948  ORF Transcript_11551/g.37948 Transcript_11551/m.37948 type:complete len:297 (+) Transcript_11551:860-1750(+)